MNRIKDRRDFIKKISATTLAIAFGNSIFPHPIFTQDKRWDRKANLPVNLQEIYCAVVKKKIHVAGGFLVTESSYGATDQHFAYNPKKDNWSTKAALPEQRHHPQMVAHNGKLYALGGFNMIDQQSMWIMHDNTWEYDVKSDAWTIKTASPSKHAETVAGSIGEFIHIVGGRKPIGSANRAYRDHQDTDHHLIYNPSIDKWDTAAPALMARNSAAGAVIDDQLYVTGGRTISGGNVADLEIYDPKEDKWRKGSPMPQAQGGLAAAAVKGKLYAFGGEYFNDGGGVYPECWCYDPKTDHWNVSFTMTTPRHGLAGAAIGRTLYSIAGAKKASLRETSNILEAVKMV